MKTQELQSAIKKLKRIVSTRNTLPILDYIYNDNGTIMASDLEVTHIINVGFPGKFLVDTKELSRILDKLPKDADITVVEKDLRILIKISGMGEFNLTGAKVEDFPRNPKVAIAIGSLLASDVALMRRAAKFVADDDLRPVMNGIYLEKKIVASDAHRLVYFPYSRGLKRNVLIPSRVAGLLDLVDYRAYTNDGNKNIRLVNDTETLIIRLIDGNYPQYDAVIPKDNKIVYMVEKKLLQETVKLALVAANEASNLIRFNFSGTTLTVSAQDIDFDRSFTRTINVKHPSTEKTSLQAGFKGTFLLELLAESGDSVKLAFSTPDRAALIDNDKLLMPMMIQS